MRWIALIVFILSFPALYSQEPNPDSLKQLLAKPLHDSVRISVLGQLFDIVPFEEGLKYNEEMMKLAEKNLQAKNIDDRLKLQYANCLAVAYNNISFYYYENADMANSFKWLELSCKTAEKYGLDLTMAECYVSLGVNYSKMGDQQKAIDYDYKALKIFEKLKDTIGITSVLNSLGAVYFYQQDYKKARESLNRSLSMGKKANLTFPLAEALEYLGLTCFKLQEYDEAIRYYKESIEVAQTEGPHSTRLVINILGYTGQAFEYKGMLDSAEYYYTQSGDLAAPLNNKEVTAAHASRLGSLYEKKGNYVKALSYSKEAYKLGKELDNISIVQSASLTLYRVYKKQGNSAEALKMYESYISMRDSVANQKIGKDLEDQKLKHELEKKELELRAENEKNANELKLRSEREHARKNLWIIVLIAVSVLLLTGSFFLFNYFRQKSTIAGQKESILKQKLLVSQMNPHFIFNSLNAIQNYIFKQDSLTAGTYLSQFAELMRMILDYSRRDLIKLSEEIKLLNNYFELQQLRFEFKFSYSIEVDKELEPSEVLIPPMLAQPFIENAIEHGIFYKEGKGNIFLRISRQEDRLVYEIEDDGVGLERSMELNKQKKMEHKSLATIITKERIDSMEQKGTTGNQIEITDLAKVSSGRQGVKVRFVIPYRQT